jgi:Ras-like protein family protein 10B
LLQQFVWNEFSEQYSPTSRRHTYHPTVILNDRIYELKLSDIPVISYFPHDSFAEWADFRFYGLRSATAYVLVYDLSNAETFQYIRTLREQMAESRDMRNVPVLVVGNKQDLVVTDPGTYHHSGTSGYSPGGTANSAVCLMEQGLATQAQQKFAMDYAREKRDIVNFVKKHWKCGYVECSAKFNWKIMALFKELTVAIDLLSRASGTGTGALGGHHGSSKDQAAHPTDNFHGGNKCSIL